MEELLRFISTYEMGVYVIFGVVILFNLKKLLDGLTSLRKANFGLEKEVARKKLKSAITIIGLFLIFGLSVFVLVSVATIRIPGVGRIATPTINLASTPSPNSSEGAVTPESQQLTQTAIALTGCIPGQLEWIDPAEGSEVTGSVDLKGTVNVPNLGFYKYEYRFQSDESWTPISAGNKPIIEDLFSGRWNTTQLTPGNYSLRLVVSDNQNNLLKPCEIDVTVLPQ